MRLLWALGSDQIHLAGPQIIDAAYGGNLLGNEGLGHDWFVGMQPLYVELHVLLDRRGQEITRMPCMGRDHGGLDGVDQLRQMAGKLSALLHHLNGGIDCAAIGVAEHHK